MINLEMGSCVACVGVSGGTQHSKTARPVWKVNPLGYSSSLTTLLPPSFNVGAFGHRSAIQEKGAS